MDHRLKAVIFDLDGTLVNAYQAVEQSMNFALVNSGFKKVPALTIKRSVGWGDRQLMERFVGPQHAPRVLKIYRDHHKESLKTGVRFLAGAERLIKDLSRRDYILAIATNRPQRFTRIILDVLNIEDRFDYVLCGDKIERPKPYPDMLRAILKRYDLRTQESLYVGDMTIDVQTGNSAGVRTVAVLTGSSTEKEIRALKPFKIIPRISHLHSIIKSLE